MLWTIVSASIVTAIVSLICIVGVPYFIAPTQWGIRVLTGFKTPFALVLSGHAIIFLLATLVGLLAGSFMILGRVPKSLFWILGVVALATSLLELLTDLCLLTEKLMRKPLLARKLVAEKATMLVGAIIGIAIWFLLVPIL
ncbi:MAG: hypothetical protein ABSB63_02225 [Spirochaetia bacterium]|jgi:hypothetical protein